MLLCTIVILWVKLMCVCVSCLFLGFRSTHWSAPEVQTQSTVSAASDMFSLGLVVAAIFNRGRPLIQANHSNPNYTKQMEMVILHWPRIKTLFFTTNISFNITGIILLDSRSIASSPPITLSGWRAISNQNYSIAFFSDIHQESIKSAPNRLRLNKSDGL